MEIGVASGVVGFAVGVFVTMKFSSKVSAAITSLETSVKGALTSIETAIKNAKL